MRLLFKLPARSPREAVEAYTRQVVDFGLSGRLFAAEDLTTNEITLWTGAVSRSTSRSRPRGVGSDDADLTEYAVPVRWRETRSLDEAVWQRGLFASQLSACRLRDERTLELLRDMLALNEE